MEHKVQPVARVLPVQLEEQAAVVLLELRVLLDSLVFQEPPALLVSRVALVGQVSLVSPDQLAVRVLLDPRVALEARVHLVSRDLLVQLVRLDPVEPLEILVPRVQQEMLATKVALDSQVPLGLLVFQVELDPRELQDLLVLTHNEGQMEVRVTKVFLEYQVHQVPQDYLEILGQQDQLELLVFQESTVQLVQLDSLEVRE